MSTKRVSLVIPAYNEQALLPRLLSTVNAACAAYHGGADAIEVIVADNESTDRTADIARSFGCSVVTAPIHRIGAVRNAGAAVATGDILAFVDADSTIHRDTFNVIDSALQNGRVVGGSTGATMERWSAGIVVTYCVIVPVVWLTGFDTGVVFCRRSDFEDIGGYDETMPYAEDVKFLQALKQHGKRRSQKLVRARSIKVVASARKFDKFGDWHFLTVMPGAALQVLRSRDNTEFADRYWYKPDR